MSYTISYVWHTISYILYTISYTIPNISYTTSYIPYCIRFDYTILHMTLAKSKNHCHIVYDIVYYIVYDIVYNIHTPSRFYNRLCYLQALLLTLLLLHVMQGTIHLGTVTTSAVLQTRLTLLLVPCHTWDYSRPWSPWYFSSGSQKGKPPLPSHTI